MNIGADYPPLPLLNPPAVASIQQPPSLVQMYADSKAATTAATQPQRDSTTVYIEKKKGGLFRIAVIATFAFVILSNNIAYKVVNQIYNAVTGNINHIMSEDGCPTYKGLLIHAGIFFVLILILLFT
jgi:hypothetical protein